MEYEPCLDNGKRPSIKKLSGPDGVEAWSVAFAAMVINFVMAGLNRMSGILFVAFIDIFHIGRKEAALPFSVRSSVRNLLGPVVGILGQKYGVRKITLLGSFVGTISAASCFYVKDILWLTILWGAINGIGTSLLTTLPQVVIGQHFKKYRTTASGMSFSGGCFGSFLFPALLEFLLHVYGLGGTYLIIAGIIMHTVPAAMLLKTPSWLLEEKNTIHIISNGNNIRVTSNENRSNNLSIEKYQHHTDDLQETPQKTGISDSHLSSNLNNSISRNFLNTSKKSVDSTVDISFLRKHEEVVTEILINCMVSLNNLSDHNHASFRFSKRDLEILLGDIYHDVEFKKGSVDTKEVFNDAVTDSFSVLQIHGSKDIMQPEINRTFSNNEDICRVCQVFRLIIENDPKDILGRFSEDQHTIVSQTISEIQKLCLVLDHSQFASNAAEVETCPDANNKNCEGSNTFLVHIKTALRLHTKPLFLLICLCRSVHFLTFMPVVTTIVDFSMDKGLLEEDGKYVIAALSLGDLTGRLCLGWITDRGYVSLPRVPQLLPSRSRILGHQS